MHPCIRSAVQVGRLRVRKGGNPSRLRFRSQVQRQELVDRQLERAVSSGLRPLTTMANFWIKSVH